MTKYRRNKSRIGTEISQGLGEAESSEFIDNSRCTYSEGIDIYEYNGKVTINGFLVYGRINHHGRCSKCSHITVFDDDWDSYFCPQCNIWLHVPEIPGQINWTPNILPGICRCYMCSNRPDKPLPDFGVNDCSYPIRPGLGLEKYESIVLE